MAKIALIADNFHCRSAYLDTCKIPRFYMEDFSILGFTVQQYDKACELLRKAGFKMLDKKFAADILIDDAQQLVMIRDILQNNGIKAELSDIADTIYQA